MLYKKIRQSLRLKLILASVAVEVIMLTLLLGNSLRIINNTIQEQTALYVESINPLLVVSLSEYVFTRDYATLIVVLDKLVKAPMSSFTYIAVFDDQNQVYARTGRIPDSLQTLYESRKSRLDSSILHESTPLFLADQNVGKVYYGLDISAFITSRENILQQGVLIAVVEILLTALLLSLVGYYLTRHLYELLTGIRKVTQGQYDKDISIASEDEVGQLAAGYNMMIQAVRDRVDALTDEKQRLQITLESIADAVITTNKSGKIDYINPVAETLTCWSNRDGVGVPLSTVYKIHNGGTGKAIENHVEECLHNSAVLHSGPHAILVTREGTELAIEDTVAPIQDHNKETIGVILVFRDITERIARKKELLQHRYNLEKLVSRRTQELETINDELESFSYSVSHDLRAPLRSIDGFSRALQEDCTDQINEQGKDFLSRIRNSVQRMGALIDDLLMLSRTTRRAFTPVMVNISELAEKIMGQLHVSKPEREVEVEIKSGLEMYADPGLIETVLENLLGNAWKYTGKQEHARIELGQIVQNGEVAIYVRDNGVGFDMRYVGKLFGAFQRLHSTDEFPGTGIGLATVERIINRHGGRVWVESAVNKGATFYFYLPEHAPEAVQSFIDKR